MHPSHRLSVAPMMAYTDRHFRFMMRLFTKKTLLYTEMVVAETIHHNRGNGLLDKILAYDAGEHPLAVQLGGDDSLRLCQAARICEDRGFDEVNLNVGCPSDRVQKGRFGACLMKEPEHVGHLLADMQAAVNIPVTVKHRLGVDDLDQYEHAHRFIDVVAKSGVQTFIIHARKAWLKGLSPAQNRHIPPLRYDWVYRLKQDFPHLTIILNGGVTSLDQCTTHLQHTDGVMVGRAAYHQPQIFAAADSQIFGAPPQTPLSDEALIASMDRYIHKQQELGVALSFPMKHLVGLFKNRRGSRKWRQSISKLVQAKPSAFDLRKIYREAFHAEPDDLIPAAALPSLSS